MLALKTLLLDWQTIATSAAIIGLGGTTLLLWRSLGRIRGVLGRDLERIFEQLDLLRLDAQQLAENSATVPVPAREPPVLAPSAAATPIGARAASSNGVRLSGANGEAGDYYAAARLAASGTPISEISERCGIVSGEARVLVALEQARARRASGP
jgi:hypothetical protein